MSPTLHPDPDQARSWIEEELSSSEYDQEPSAIVQWLEDLLETLSSWWPSAEIPTVNSSIGWLVVILLGVAVLVCLMIWLRPGRYQRAKAGADASSALTDQFISPDEYRKQAEAARNAGDWNTLALCSFRALVRESEERVLIDHRPGMTATEAALRLGWVFPQHREQLQQVAELFNGIEYGQRSTQRHWAEGVADLEGELRRQVPVSAQVPDGILSGVR